MKLMCVQYKQKPWEKVWLKLSMWNKERRRKQKELEFSKASKQCKSVTKFFNENWIISMLYDICWCLKDISFLVAIAHFINQVLVLEMKSNLASFNRKKCSSGNYTESDQSRTTVFL